MSQSRADTIQTFEWLKKQVEQVKDEYQDNKKRSFLSSMSHSVKNWFEIGHIKDINAVISDIEKAVKTIAEEKSSENLPSAQKSLYEERKKHEHDVAFAQIITGLTKLIDRDVKKMSDASRHDTTHMISMILRTLKSTPIVPRKWETSLRDISNAVEKLDKKDTPLLSTLEARYSVLAKSLTMSPKTLLADTAFCWSVRENKEAEERLKEAHRLLMLKPTYAIDNAGKGIETPGLITMVLAEPKFLKTDPDTHKTFLITQDNLAEHEGFLHNRLDQNAKLIGYTYKIADYVLAQNDGHWSWQERGDEQHPVLPDSKIQSNQELLAHPEIQKITFNLMRETLKDYSREAKGKEEIASYVLFDKDHSTSKAFASYCESTASLEKSSKLEESSKIAAHKTHKH